MGVTGFEPQSLAAAVWPLDKFPVLIEKFPVLRNIFPVNSFRELHDNALRHSGFFLAK
jgi:hypothetical protein